MHQLPSQGWKTNKTCTRFEPEHEQPILHTKSSRKTNKTSTRFEPEHKQPMLHTKSSRKTNKTSTRFEPEHKQPMLHTKSSKDDESSGDGVAVGSSKLTRSKKKMRRRQLVPTYNASTPFTRLENKQD
jgi:hypothetical protein